VTDIEQPVRDEAKFKVARLAVIILTTLFALAIVALVIGFIRQARILMASRAAHAVTAPAVPQDAAAVLTLAPGARILSAQTDAGKLVLHVSTPTGGEVEIIDLASGRLAGQVKTRP
jgi:hypothetical protein